MRTIDFHRTHPLTQAPPILERNAKSPFDGDCGHRLLHARGHGTKAAGMLRGNGVVSVNARRKSPGFSVSNGSHDEAGGRLWKPSWGFQGAPGGVLPSTTPDTAGAKREARASLKEMTTTGGCDMTRSHPLTGQHPGTFGRKLTMTKQNSRRDILKGSLALAGLGALGIPDWALPLLAQGETLVPFTDLPETINLRRSPERRIIDIRMIDGPFTPRDQFFTTQHYGHPEIDPATFRLRISGLVERPASLSLDDLRGMPSTELIFGFECSGNRGPINGLSSNGRWTGVPLRAVLDRAGVRQEAQELVFFGADHGEEEVEFRGRTYPVDQQFGRSLSRDKALSSEPILAYAMNGEPLTRHQGFPLRLLIPGWYGVSNVKWLSEIHVQEDRYLGKFQARWYRTLKGEMVNGEMKWKETAITRMRLKSFIARVTDDGRRHQVFGIVLHDGTPLRSVEVKIDEGPWQAATMDPATSSQYSWKFFTYDWNGATPGAHTITSRVTDAKGDIQPTEDELGVKQTFLEHNAQLPRTVMIA